jgi:hypothetical protein
MKLCNLTEHGNVMNYGDFRYACTAGLGSAEGPYSAVSLEKRIHTLRALVLSLQVWGGSLR